MGLHVGGTSGAMHDDKSNSMNSSTFSCGVIGEAPLHSPGKRPLALPPVLTWKSEYRTRPHCWAGILPHGVSKLNSSGWLVPLRTPYIHCCVGVLTVFVSLT